MVPADGPWPDSDPGLHHRRLSYPHRRLAHSTRHWHLLVAYRHRPSVPRRLQHAADDYYCDEPVHTNSDAGATVGWSQLPNRHWLLHRPVLLQSRAEHQIRTHRQEPDHGVAAAAWL